MRLFIFFFLFLSSPTLIFAQSTEEEQIKKIIESETYSFLKESMSNTVSKYWILDDHTMRCISFLDGSTYQHRAEDLVQSDVVPPVGHATFKKYNIKTNIVGSIAYVTNDQEVILGDSTKQYTHELWVVEKVKGEWKIHLYTAHHFLPK
jgi:hypothetical protein